MLVLSDVEKLTPRYVQLLADFRRTHISRFPVEVEVINAEFIVFIDSRFRPELKGNSYNVRNSLGSVYSDGDKIVVESRLIQNEKYNMHNTDYHTRKTQDMRKVLKYMKEYLKPYSAQEIAHRSLRNAESAYDDYKQKKAWKAMDYYQLNTSTLYEELLHMQTIGYVPRTQAIQKALTEGLPLMQEYKEIEKKAFTKLHVYVAPDGSVTVSVLAKYVNMEMGTTTFESLESAPTLIQQHVGMLKMMDKNTHVPNVGYKSSDTEFWIEGIS